VGRIEPYNSPSSPFASRQFGMRAMSGLGEAGDTMGSLRASPILAQQEMASRLEFAEARVPAVAAKRRRLVEPRGFEPLTSAVRLLR
jgi:hypothetical protein